MEYVHMNLQHYVYMFAFVYLCYLNILSIHEKHTRPQLPALNPNFATFVI